jgi:hypothetical protein
MITNTIKTLLLSCLLIAASLAHAGDWFAVAADDELNWGVKRHANSKATAIKGALGVCKEVATAPCKIVVAESLAGFLILASSPSYLHYALNEDEDEARRIALGKCAKKTPVSQTCKVVLSEYNGTSPKANKVASTVQPSGNCRPRTATVRCQSRCTNGDCVVTYENGCKLRMQVGSHYNVLENRWEYDSPNC